MRGSNGVAVRCLDCGEEVSPRTVLRRRSADRGWYGCAHCGATLDDQAGELRGRRMERSE